MATGTVQSFGVLNYSGLLFNKGNTRTPLLSAISGRRQTTNHVEFVCGQEYTTEGGTQPTISETASLTAPTATYITREQKTNVTQIFQESVAISYAKQSNMGTLSGTNIANQQANPMNELDFQVAAKMAKIGRDIEFTFMQGTYQKATSDSQANKTRGLNTAITTNTKAMSSAELTVWDVADLMTTMSGNGAPIDDLVLWCDANALMQLNADAARNKLTIVPAGREVNGIQISTLITPVGTVGVYLGEFIPSGTAFLLNLGVMHPVEQPTPGKGNFFLEELSKAGAGTSYQIFGQIGLNYGPEWYHGKFTGLSTSYTRPKANSEDNPLYTQAVGAGG